MASASRPGLNTTELCGSLIDRSQDAFLALRHDGTIVFASEALRSLIGYDPAAVVGHNVVDWLRGDDLERALLQLGESLSHMASGVTRFSVATIDGNYVPIEIAGSVVTDGEQELIGLCARDGRDQARVEEVLGLLLDGVPRAEALAPVVDTIAWQALGSKVAIEWVDDTGRHQVKSEEFDDALAGSDGPSDDVELDPWSRSRLTLEGQRGAASDEGGWLRAVADEAGVDSYWIEPVRWSPRYVPATVTVWTTPEHPIEAHAYGMGVAKHLLELILRWTAHVPRLEDETRSEPPAGAGAGP